VPGETDELREVYGARVEKITEMEASKSPSLPGAGLPKTWDGIRRTAEVMLSWPLHNIGPSLPNLLATVAGNLSELKAFSGLKLMDVVLPPDFLSAYQGPQYGIQGTRQATNVYGRPIIGTIIKPSIGQTSSATAAQVKMLAEAGIDFIKDDELQSDGPGCRFRDRIEAVQNVLNRYCDQTGRRVMYAANITGEIDEMLDRLEQIETCGGTCAMVSINSIGLPAMKMVRSRSKVVIHGHRNGWGMLGRSPAIGMSFVAFQKLWRLAGVDHLHVNGLHNKFCETNESVILSARECLTPMFGEGHPGCEVMPVFSSGQSAKQAPETYQALGRCDLIYACGGGIMGHPMGVRAGVVSIHQAWEAAMRGIPLSEYAAAKPELKAALQMFGN
jgi:ribulose-bisphosphate carboxylase large chain